MTRTLLRNRSLLSFMSARAAATMGYQMVGVAVGWQVYELTSRAFDLGMVGLVQFIPLVALILVVGQVADRCDRRRIISLCQLVESAALVALVWLPLSHAVTKETIFLIVFVIGCARAFE